MELAWGFVGLLVTVVGGLWAYTKLVLEKGLLPPSEFDVDCHVVGPQGNKKVLEVLLKVKNLGSETLVVSNLRVDIRYAEDIESSDELELFSEPKDDRFGSVIFPKSLLRNDLEFEGKILVKKSDDGKARVEVIEHKDPPAPASRTDRIEKKGERGFPLMRYDTIIGPSVSQVYTLVTAVPLHATYVIVFGSFHYGLHPNPFQQRVLAMSRKVGLLQFSLAHIARPHTAQRAFSVRERGSLR